MSFHLSIFTSFVISSWGIPLYGGIGELGYYFVDVLVGTPAQRISAILDTGSDGLSITCSTCASCGAIHMDPFYNPDISETFARLEKCPASHLRNTDCIFEKRYLEGSSLKGKIISDVISFENSQINKTMGFGCIESETKLFMEQAANGLMGLAPQAKTNWLFSNEKIEAFSLCLSRHGGELEFYHTRPQPGEAVLLQYRNGHYVVEPLKIGLKDSKNYSWEWETDEIMKYLGDEVLIDSGSTETYLVSEFYDKIVSHIRERVRNSAFEPPIIEDPTGPALCWLSDVTETINPLLPEILFTFPKILRDDNTTVVFNNYTYFSASRTCLGIASNGRLKRTDLGASWLINRKIILTSSQGWATFEPTQCEEHRIETRQPVIPLPGHIERNRVKYFLPVLSAVIMMTALLIHIVRRHILFPYRGYDSVIADTNEHTS